MSRTARIAGWVLLVVAVVFLVLTWRVLRSPVVEADGTRCASVWHVHRHGGQVLGGMLSSAERQDVAQRCSAAGASGWREAQGFGLAGGASALVGAVVLAGSHRRQQSLLHR